MEDNLNCETTYDLLKIPKKKMNFQQLLYKRKIQIGKFASMDIILNSLKFQNKKGKLVYKIEEDEHNTIDNTKEKEEQLLNNNPFYRNLFYSSELDLFIMPSKRELLLRRMLNERIKKLKTLIKN